MTVLIIVAVVTAFALLAVVVNDAVTVTGGLTCTALTNPSIGTQSGSGSTGFTVGDLAEDLYVSVSATTTPATALHADLVANGFVSVSNPASIGGVENTITVTLYVGTTKLGPILPGMTVVIPVSTGQIIGGVVASTAVTVGVTAIKTTANA